ncbi:MAG TPA: carbamoyltransferase N-terminal domain-containing protein [Elusimicrobiota bacterium]|nr:carbamoyltransferase N-terminal domain-containing protein [Elusimicrobiota bacterium]
MTRILGLSFDYHDAAAALVVDGVAVAAAAEERFSRVKHDRRLPVRAAGWCLERAGLAAGDLDAVVFYEKPFRKLSRILANSLDTFPSSASLFRRAAGAWLDERLWVGPRIERALGLPPGKVLYCEHHLSHAASAFYPSPFDDAAVLTIDGVGEWATASVGRGRRGADGRWELALEAEMRYPHSLGLLYSAFTAYLGFEVNEGEYKVMGLAPYGRPRFADRVRRMIEPFGDGSFRLDLDWFAFHRDPARAFARRFEDAFGPARAPSAGDPAQDPRLCDVAASVQLVCEELVLAMAKEAHRRTGSRNLCLSGGVALNAVANGRLLRESPFERVWIQPAAGDAGGALGAALYAAHALGGAPRSEMRRADLGPEHSPAAAAAALAAAGLEHEELSDRGELCARVAGMLAGGRVVGWHQGRSEWGPRALGQRSILADPRPAAMKRALNEKIKFRELFRPFAPSAAAEAAGEWFDLGPGPAAAPYRFMLATAPVREDRRAGLGAVTHVDGTARVQAVGADDSPLYHELISSFGAATGVPVLLNTSFNLKGEPIVETPEDAISTFLASSMDALVLGPFLVPRRPEGNPSRRSAWAASATPSDGWGW